MKLSVKAYIFFCITLCGLMQSAENKRPEWMVDFNQSREDFETNVLKGMHYSSFGVSAQPLYAYLFYRFHGVNKEIFTPITVPAGILTSKKEITDPIEVISYWLNKYHCSVKTIAGTSTLDITGSASAIAAENYFKNNVLNRLTSAQNRNIYFNYVALQIQKEKSFTTPFAMEKIAMPTKEAFFNAFDAAKLNKEDLDQNISGTLFELYTSKIIAPEKKLSSIDTEIKNALEADVVSQEKKEEFLNKNFGSGLGSIISAQDVRTWNAPVNKNHEILELCDTEKAFIKKRIQKTNVALIDFLAEGDTKLNEELKEKKDLPLIAGCGSGGGFRAMYSFSGALEAFEQNKLLSTIVFLAGLSGSTWALGPQSESGQSYATFVGGFLSRINLAKANFKTSLGNLATIAAVALKNRNVMDTYTSLLQKTLFVPYTGANPPTITLKTLQKNLVDGNNPMPIFTAIFSPNNNVITHLWCDMTPFDVACYKLRSAVDPDKFGGLFEARTFFEDYGPLTLSQILTICGSAFAVSGKENEGLNKYLGKNKTTDAFWTDAEVENDLKTPINLSKAGYFEQVRYAKFIINNIAYKATDDQVHNIPFSEQAKLPIVDAGIDCNIPLHPLLQRDRINNLDLIIVIDASGDLPNSFELLKAKIYAQQNGLRFPDISQTKYPHYKTDPFTLFGINENAPLILYIPIAWNPIYKEIKTHYFDAWKAVSPMGTAGIEFNLTSYKDLLNQSKDSKNKDLLALQEKLTMLIKAKNYDSKEQPLERVIKLVERMINFDPVKEMNGGFMGTFNFDYSLDIQVPQVRDTFIIALYQALPAVRNALLDRINPQLRIDRDKRRQEALEKAKEKFEEEVKEKNAIFEDFAKALNQVAGQ